MNKYLEEAEKYARIYDQGAIEQRYYGPELLFGLMYEYLGHNDRILDIAIGTGLDALLFKKAGAEIWGVDGGAEMLKICREKNAADELVQVDLLKDPIPWPDSHFNLALANALFHMIENPVQVFMEASRLLRREGIFGFTIDETRPWKSAGYKDTATPGVVTRPHPESGMNMYRHSDGFIRELCSRSGFEELKKTEFLVFQGKEGSEDFYFSAYIVRKFK
jgi:predicted TPR repeat methyltransferase